MQQEIADPNKRTIMAIMADGKPRTATDLQHALCRVGVTIPIDDIPWHMMALSTAGHVRSRCHSGISCWELPNGQVNARTIRTRGRPKTEEEAAAGIVKIVERVAHRYQLSAASLLGRSSRHRIAFARKVAMHEAWRAGFSYNQIGHVFSRDSTTVGKLARQCAGEIAAEAAE